MVGKLNLNYGCRGNAGLDGRIQILFFRHEYSSPQGRLSYNNKPLISLVFGRGSSAALLIYYFYFPPRSRKICLLTAKACIHMPPCAKDVLVFNERMGK